MEIGHGSVSPNNLNLNDNASAVCGGLLDSEAAAAVAVRRSDCAAARCHCGTARVRQLSTRQDLAGREPAEVTVHLADCQWSSSVSRATVGRGLDSLMRPATASLLNNVDVSRNSINRALFGHRLHIFGIKIVGYVWMNVIRTNSVDNNDLITILN
jgi:hypothetical protein